MYVKSVVRHDVGLGRTDTDVWYTIPLSEVVDIVKTKTYENIKGQ